MHSRHYNNPVNAQDCFHGTLDRRSAEERLTSRGKLGAYLLRQSDRRAGSYVLSYNGKSGINHFRITHVYGSYFIGGRQFDSLSQIIQYYSSNCDLLTEERLLFPIQPPEPVASKERLFISVLPYTKLAQSDELSFMKGDLFILHNDLGDGWFWCRDVKSGNSGMVFSDLVEEIHEDIDPNEVFPWFHAHVTKAEAVNKLAQAGPGSFLVRPSDNSPGNYTLFYHVESTIQRFLIVRNSENRYTMGGKCFDSLGQIIDMYHKEQIIEGHTLQFPVTTTMSRADQLSETTLSTSMRALEIRGKPQDVYNTVKLSREAAKKKQKGELSGWLSMKKDDIFKKWKCYYFVLNSRDKHLYYYEKPQQTKPKGLVDLTYSYIYRLHESLFDSQNCFQLVEKTLPCFGNHFFLKCDDGKQTFDSWVQSVGKFTSQDQSNIENVNSLIEQGSDSNYLNVNARGESTQACESRNFEYKRNIILNFMEAHSIKVSQPFFLISFNHDIKVAKTLVKNTPNAAFIEDGFFKFDNISADVKSITISIYQSGKKSKSPMEFGRVIIDINCLKSGNQQFDQWFEFQSLHSSEPSCFLRVKIMKSTDIVMGYTEFAALEDLICDPSAEIVEILDQVCKRDHLALARSMSNILRHNKGSTETLKAMINRQSSNESDSLAIIFKTSSLPATLFESYIRSMSQEALEKSLREPVTRLLDDKISCEINMSKLETQTGSSKACENLQNLLDLLDQIVSNIYNSVQYYPIPVRYLLSCLREISQLKRSKEPLIRTRVVSCFLFLHIICPTILNPKQFNLTHATPSENAIRNLTLVTKCLQNLANMVETAKHNNPLASSILTTLGDYATYPPNALTLNRQNEYSVQTNSILAFILSPQIESWMEVVNPFILKNKIGMVKFVDELCNVDPTDITSGEFSVDSNNNDVEQCKNSWVLAQDLATIHMICEKYRTELEQLATSSSIAKKFLTTLTILSQHKQYYLHLRQSTQNISTSQI